MLPRILTALLRPTLMLAGAALFAPASHAGDLSLDLKLGGKHGQVAVHLGGHSDGYGRKVKTGKIGYRPHRRVVTGCAIHRSCVPARHWSPGHYESRDHRVWIPERREKVWVPAVYGTRYDHCGRPYQVLVQPARWSVVCNPGYFETRCERVWIPGCFKTTCAVY